jgi:type IV pilus assembly protein PilF
MLKNLSVVLALMMLLSCASEPTQKGFAGTGNFDKVEAAKTRVSLGLTYLQNGNFSQAKFNLDKALEFAPRSGQANFAMAFYYQQVDEVQRAHEYYKQAIEFSKNDPDVLNSYGAFLCKQGDYEQAKRYFLQAVDDKSYVSTAETYENLAMCSQSQEKTQEAIEYFTSALNHQPTRTTSLLYLAQLYTQTQQWELAKKTLWKYERNASVTADTLWLSFQVARGQDDLRAALEYAEILKRLYPDNPNTATALASLGKFQPNMTVTPKSRVVTSNVAVDTSVVEADRPVEELLPYIGNPGKLNKVNDETELALEQAFETIETEPVATSTLDSSSVTAIEPDAAIMQEAMVSDSAIDTNTDTNIETNANTPFHIVQAKENLYRITLKYNVKMKKLLEWNDLDDASAIKVGTKLWLRDPKTNE